MSAATTTNEFVIVALGDSTMQALGAKRPQDGVAGRVANLSEKRFGKEVRVVNLSVSGAKLGELVKEQLPKAKDIKADLIIVSIGANDAAKKSDLDNYAKYYNQLISAMPLEKTVFANTPDVINRDQYEKIFQRLALENNLKVAKIYETVYPHRNDPLMYAGDFYHPSSKGYLYWYQAFKPEVLKIIE